jgi:hypothetical protein
MEKRRLSTNQLVTVVVAVCAAIVLAPVTVMAATGSFVNITDPTVASHKAKVGSTGGLYTAQVDPSTGSVAKVDTGKVRVGDGSGALTVDGAVRTADSNAVVYASPAAGGLTCGSGLAGVSLGTLDLSRYSRLRLYIDSGSTQTIVRMEARAGTQTFLPYFLNDYTLAANNQATLLLDAPPSSVDVRVFFCTNAHIVIYGLTN